MITIIENKNGINLKSRIKELKDYKELLWTLAYKDFRVKYAQTFLGLLWGIIEPLATAILLSLIFNKVAKANTYGINPLLYGMSGMIVWNYFSNAVTMGSNSLIMAQSMIQKIYFPRILLPASKAISAIPDLIISLIFTSILYLIYWDFVPLRLVLLPIFILIAIIATLGLGIWFSALNIRFRDFEHIVPFILRIGMFLTPIAYSLEDLPSKYKLLFYLNPMTGIIEGIRWCMFDIKPDTDFFILSIAISLILLISGFLYFNRFEKNIADII